MSFFNTTSVISSNDESSSVRWITLSEEFDLDELDFYGQNTEDESQLRRPLGFMKLFMNSDECVDYIRNIHDDLIILTVAGRFARHVVPHIHDFPQLAAVYVVCKSENKERNKEWSKDYPKVRAIVSDHEEHISVISRNHFRRRSQQQVSALPNAQTSIDRSRIRFYETATFNVFDSTGNTYTDLSTENGNFIWMQLLVEVLLRMGSLKNPMAEFFRMCKEFLNRDDKDWEQIVLFGAVYDSCNPIRWYTKAPFVYQFVNEILRSRDIDKLITLRIVVRDIYNKLREEQRKFAEPLVITYRGQAMKSKELEKLQRCVGHLISVNSFLSTSKDRMVAVMYAKAIDENNPNLKSVLFEIESNTCRPDTKPFADITHLSVFGDEREILFMLGSIFQVHDVYKDETEDMWIVKLVLCGEKDHQFRNAFESMKNDIPKNPSLTSLGLLLQKTGDFQRAAKCFQQHLNSLEPDDVIIRAACYHNLGNTIAANGDYDKALDYFDESMKIRLNLPSTDKFIMGSLHNDTGVTYNQKKNYEKALEHYEKAVSFMLESVGENNVHFAGVCMNIGVTYNNQKKYELALCNFNKCLEIQNKLNLTNRPELANTLRCIGTLYALKDEHSMALLYLREGLDIEQKILPNNHVQLAISYNNIGSTYSKIGRLDLALENFKMAERIFRNALPPEHPNIQATTINIVAVETMLKRI